MKVMTMEDQVGPLRSDLVTSSWRVVIIWMPRAQEGNSFDWLITLRRVRRSEKGMNDSLFSLLDGGQTQAALTSLSS